MIYTIVGGDTLGNIAKRFTGERENWRVIWFVNQNSMRSSNPNIIFPGERLWIPPQYLLAEPDGAREIERANKADVALSATRVSDEAARNLATFCIETATLLENATASMIAYKIDTELPDELRKRAGAVLGSATDRTASPCVAPCGKSSCVEQGCENAENYKAPDGPA